MSRRTQFRLLVAFSIVWAVWAGWSLLGQATTYTLRVLDDAGAPVDSAVVDINGRQAGTSGEDGLVHLEWNRSSTVVQVSAPGHESLTVTVSESPEEVVDAVLKARVLRGSVVDADGKPVASAQVITDSASGITDASGRFGVRGAEPGTVRVVRPAWVEKDFEWDGGPGEQVVELTPFTARAVHISGEAAGDNLDYFFDLARSTELNALMVDLKDETGLVWYNSQDPTALEVGAVRDLFDLRALADRAHGDDLYLIGRLVIFSDPTAAVRKPSMAIWDSSTNKPFVNNGQYFLDPTDPDARAYALSLAKEACGMGVDEVQFDYVRFPDTRIDTMVFDGRVDQDGRVKTIKSFLADAVQALHPMGCAVAADIFGFITNAIDDGGIGQRWEEMTEVVDVASPMLYPSHYDSGWYGFDDPNDHPGPMVTQALEDGLARLPRSVVVRPWLQDFGYDASQVRAQIDSTEQFGLGWMLWNAHSNVTTDALVQ